MNKIILTKDAYFINYYYLAIGLGSSHFKFVSIDFHFKYLQNTMIFYQRRLGTKKGKLLENKINK